jgi:RHS repeat-associated protein
MQLLLALLAMLASLLGLGGRDEARLLPCAGGNAEPISSPEIIDYRNRQFDPATGRFLQRDPVLGGDELFNPYCFPGNNPVTGSDPMGTEWELTSTSKDGTITHKWKWKPETGKPDPYYQVPEDAKKLFESDLERRLKADPSMESLASIYIEGVTAGKLIAKTPYVYMTDLSALGKIALPIYPYGGKLLVSDEFADTDPSLGGYDLNDLTLVEAPFGAYFMYYLEQKIASYCQMLWMAGKGKWCTLGVGKGTIAQTGQEGTPHGRVYG